MNFFDNKPIYFIYVGILNYLFINTYLVWFYYSKQYYYVCYFMKIMTIFTLINGIFEPNYPIENIISYLKKLKICL